MYDSSTSFCPPPPQLFIKTIAGTLTSGTSVDGGAATSVQLSKVYGIAIDSNGNAYIADYLNSAIRFVNKQTGNLTTIAGIIGVFGSSGDNGNATSANLNYPYGLSLDTTNNFLYIADQGNHKIRMVTLSTGIITTFAGKGEAGAGGDGGAAIDAQLLYPQGVTNDPFGNVYIADTNNDKLRKVDSAGIISTFVAAPLSHPQGIACDTYGNVYISDSNNLKVRMVNNAGIMTTIAGDGYSNDALNVDDTPATSAHFTSPVGVAVDSNGNVYIADAMKYVIYRVTNGTGEIKIFAGVGIWGDSGDGGAATGAYLSYPRTLAVDVSGTVYIADESRVREVYAVNEPSREPSAHPTTPYYMVRLLYCFFL